MTVRKVVAFTVEVEDRPGILAEMSGPVADAGINLLAVYGGPIGGGKAKICCVPDDPAKLRALAAEGGIAVQERPHILVEGDDRPGTGAQVAQTLADAGINIEELHGAATGGKYALCIMVAPDAVDRAVKALGG